MPNWCSNNLDISGDPEQLGQLVDKLKAHLRQGTVDLFNTCVPMPKWIEHENPGHRCTHNVDGYSWAMSHWGVKWDVEISAADLEYDPQGGGLTLTFDTAWAQPEAFVLGISAQYPKLEFTLESDESANDFWGIICVENGAETRREEGPSKANQETEEEEQADADDDDE